MTEIKYNATECADLGNYNNVFSSAGKDGTGIKVTIGKNVKKIPAYLFYSSYSNSTKITEVIFEEGSVCESIGDSAFSGCSSLNKVNYTGTIDQWVQIDFGNSANNNPTYYANNLYINDVLVTEANITTATKINDYAFYNCSSLTSITIPDSVTSIGDYAFYNCRNLTSITVASDNANYKSIDGNLYSKDGKTLIQYAKGKKDTSFTIPDSVTSIGDDAFSYCSSLTSITIPNSVTSIECRAFYWCFGLTSIVFEDTSTWYVTERMRDWQNKTNGTYLDVTDASANASYFTSFYSTYYYKV